MAFAANSAINQRVSHLNKMLKGVDVMVSSETGVRQNIRKVIFAKLKGKKIVREINEWPLSVIWGEGKIKRWVEVNLLPKFFDGFICISGLLVEFCRKHGRRDIPIFKLPMTVDVEEIDSIDTENAATHRYICYAGGMTEEKDGVDTLRKAFNIVKKSFPGVELRLLHDIPHDKAISLMKGAACLVLARPDSLQARAGFPTKLGEYLATGRPVVVTRTGEIDRYLIDGESAYLAEPGNAMDIAGRIEEVLLDPAKADGIGAKGRKVALSHFDWHVHRESLREWTRQFT